ncbi:MAG: DUF2231 domain-containing protein, partial [Candidatus Binataceae bacterium]
MANVLAWITSWQIHPVVDHFSIALIVVAVIIDLVATLVPNRIWPRYMALTLMILGAIAAAGSWVTGGKLQPEWVWKTIPSVAKPLMHRHAELGTILMYAFGILALWRILIQGFSAMARTRAIYLIVAVIGVVAICYQGHLGGELVYDYGIGTAPQRAEAAPSPGASMSPTPIPSVAVPTPMPSAA